MLALARQHALDRVQFGKPIASFQAVRHRLAETLVAIEGAEATLSLPGTDNPDLTALLAKAAAGKAALTAARHCQQVLGGIGFTAEHDLQPPCEAGPGARRIAGQLKGTHPEGRRGAAGPRLGAAPRRPVTLLASRRKSPVILGVSGTFASQCQCKCAVFAACLRDRSVTRWLVPDHLVSGSFCVCRLRVGVEQ